MKKLSIVLLLICLNLISYAQIAYYDAVRLKALVDPTDGTFESDNAKLQEITGIIKKYYPNNTGNVAGFIAELKTNGNPNFNPFLKPFLDISGGLSSSPVTPNKSLTASLGNLNVASVADGIAQFLIERGKQEINIAFIEKFKQFLANYPEARTAFPTTVSFITSVESYNYNAMMPALKAAFNKDLNSLCRNLTKLRDMQSDPVYQAYKLKDQSKLEPKEKALIARVESLTKFLMDKVGGRAVIGALLIADGLVQGTNIYDIIDDLSQDPAFVVNGTNVLVGDEMANSVQLIDLISKSIKSTEEGRVYITKKQVRDLVGDDITLKLYLGLLYAENQNKDKYKIQFGSDTNAIVLKEFLTDLSKNYDSASAKFKQTFSLLTNAAAQASDTFVAISALKDGDEKGIQLYADYASALSSFLKATVDLIPDNLPTKNNLAKIQSLKHNISSFTSIIDQMVNGCYYIKSKNYAALVLSTSSLFVELSKAFAPADQEKYIRFKDDFVKYGTFMSNILEAKNGAEVKAAIEVVALPAGSYSIKRKSAWNVSLNGYVGYGLDFKLDDGIAGYAHGIAAPVGFSGTIGTKRECGIPITFFVSLIDVGSLVAYRLKNGTTDTLKQEVRLESIVSLSAQVMFGIPKTPLGLAIGYRRTPKLFYGSTNGFEVANKSKNKLNLSLLIDIPILTLHNKPH